MHIQYFESKHPVRWQWPLQIGLFPTTWSEDFYQELTGSWYHPQLVRTFFMSRGRLHTNILLFRGSIKDMVIKAAELRLPVQCDVIILFCSNDDVVGEWNRELEALANTFQCNGILFVPGTESFDYIGWLNELVIQLSHDLNFRESLEAFYPEGVLFQSSKLDKDSKLSNFTRKFIKNLKYLPVDVKDRDPGSRGKMRIRDMEKMLDEELDHYHFDHESGRASDIAEMTVETTNTVSTAVSNEGMEEEDVHRAQGDPILRYLQSQILDENEETMFKLLQTGKRYLLNVRIGPSDLKWLQGSRSAPIDIEFRDDDDEQDILIVFKSHLEETAQTKIIKIKRHGPSSVASFPFTCIEHGKEFIADIMAYHKGRLLQSASVSAYVVDNPEDQHQLPSVRMEMLTSPRMLLNNLDDRMEFAGSIYYEHEASPAGVMLNSGKQVSYRLETGLQKILKNIKRDIEEVVQHTDEYPEDLLDKDNAIIFNRLAQKGRLLYDNYLKDLGDFEGPIQIISGLHDYIPLEFVYTFPAPKLDALICPNAKEALLAGKCSDCIEKDKSPAEHICPFGFLCFSRVIERHDVNHRSELLKNGDFAFHSEPIAGRASISLLNKTIFGSAKRVESRAAGLIKKVADSIGASVTEANEADSWEKWRDVVREKNPDCLVLIVHTEDNSDLSIPQMEIGDKDFILQTHINEEIIDPAGKEPAPVVILIGCSTQDNDMPAFDFTSQFKNKGAAVVLSTFTKIRGRQAGPIVMKLFEFFNQMKGKELRFGDVMLKLRQYLLSQGIIVSLALVVNGDADWKIKL